MKRCRVFFNLEVDNAVHLYAAQTCLKDFRENKKEGDGTAPGWLFRTGQDIGVYVRKTKVGNYCVTTWKDKPHEQSNGTP